MSRSNHLQRPLHVGVSVPRFDARAKVTGAEKYAADRYAKGMLWAAAKRAGLPHGRLKAIHADRARALPGVVAVLTYRDVPGSNRQGVIKRDQPVLVDDKVRHCGDAVALVVAENRNALRDALDAIVLDVEPLPGVFDLEAAIGPDAPLVHENHPGGNVLLDADLTVGAGREAEAECDVILEGRFETPRQEHAYIETEAGWGQVEEDGRLVIVCSTQTPFRDRTEVSEALGMEPGRIRIIAPYPGGAFGGKDGVTVQTLLGLAALHAGGRPVKMWWSREESFVASSKRHLARMYYRVGAKSDGTLHFLDVRLYLDTGPYDHLGGVVMTLALEHAGGAYRIPHAHLRAWCVYTNNPIGGAFRGFGVPQVTAAMEQMMDRLAERLGIDRIELRTKNAVRRGDRICVGKTIECSAGLVECLETVERHPLWRDRMAWKAAAPRFKSRGIGVAALMHASGYGPVVPDVANAKIELTPDGTIRVYSGVVDMGQGNASTAIQMAGAILGQAPDRMELVLPDTDLTLPSGSASASRCTYTFGNALIAAAEVLKTRILQRTSHLLMARDAGDLVLVSGAVRALTDRREVPLAVVARMMDASERVAVGSFRAPVAREDIGAPPDLRLHGLPHVIFSFAAALARVEVDELTGTVDVTDYLAVSDCGRVLNPQIYEQQIQGGVAQGLGLALMEEFVVEEGRTLSGNLATYLIPTAMDCPDVESVALEIHEPTGPFGAKGIGEIATSGPVPAIAGAVADACRVEDLSPPFTGERGLLAMKQIRPSEAP